MAPDMDLLILGASTRAAAMSALRAGFTPHCVDLFADRDLRAIAPVSKVDRLAYPDGLEALASQRPRSPWIYTGALENHPELVDRIARARPLWGNPGATLRAVRDPLAVAEVLARAGMPCPRVRRDPHGLPRDGSWLLKPIASAGGRGIRPLTAEAPPAAGSLPYYQERIEGIDLAAIFVGDPEGARLLGVTRQWIGGDPVRGAFSYRGSIGPWPLAVAERARTEALGKALAASFGLVGIFGVDLVLREGFPWPVEINPRYTASVEVLELASGASFLADHARACDPSRADCVRPPPSTTPRRVVGKAILFAPAACRFPGARSRGVDTAASEAPGSRAAPTPRRFRRFADLPEPAAVFEAGEPVLTLLQPAQTLDDCQRILDRRLRSWTRRLTRSG